MAYLSLSTSNLPDPGVDPNAAQEPRDYFETFLYTGNGDGLQVGDVIKKPADTITISNSLYFDRYDTSYFTRTPSTNSNATKFTISVWFKKVQDVSGDYYPQIITSRPFGSNPTMTCGFQPGTDQLYINDSVGWNLYTTRVFKDYSRWHHLVVTFDSSLGTSTDRLKIFIDGVRETSFSTSTYPGSGVDTTLHANQLHAIGRVNANDNMPLNAYLAEFHCTDGTAYEADTFGTFDANGIWIPQTPSITYGTNGFYLDFSDNTSTTTLGEDSSGNGNDWTPSAGMSTTDQVTDSPTNNIPYNLADKHSGVTLSEGNLKTSVSTDNSHARTYTRLPSTGKWYWEAEILVTNTNHGISIVNKDYPLNITAINYADAVTYNVQNGTVYAEADGGTFYATAPVNDVVGVAFDADTGRIWFRNDTGWLNSGNPAAGTGYVHTVSTWGQEDWFPAVISHGSANKQTFFNFGQRTFAHTVPTGFSAMTEDNITVDDQNLESPDFVWIKNRDQADAHHWYDSVRGVQKALYSNATTAETDEPNGLVDFNTNGFTIGSEVEVNTSGEDYVAWCWKAGGTGVSNTNGSITSTVSANTTSGFSIVKYTGTGANATVGHGLSSTPEMVIIKGLDTTYNWVVWVDGFSTSQRLLLDTTGAISAGSWNTLPTSSVFGLGTHLNINNSGSDFIAYCFHSVDGFSKIGYYTGNGSANGPFIYTGFKPTFFMWKPTSITGSWATYDAKRSTYNTIQTGLWPNLSSAEADFGSTYAVDFVSNGVKLRGAGGGFNGSGQPHMYMAFAETPFKYSVAR